jgi:hypothetical protein
LKNLVLSSKKPKTEIGSLEEPCFGALLSNSGSNEIGTAHRVGQGSARAGRCEAALGRRWVGSGKAGSGEAGRGEATLEQRQVGLGEADPGKRETRKELRVGEERNTRMNISHFYVLRPHCQDEEHKDPYVLRAASLAEEHTWVLLCSSRRLF